MTKRELLERWNAVWREYGVTHGAPAAWFERLYVRYAHSARGYHGIEHIEDGLREFDACVELADNPRVVEMAWWGHDVVYNPRAADNELQSAAYMNYMFDAFQLPNDFKVRVYDCIMATQHRGHETINDRQLICDIDLISLGTASWEALCRNTRGIRKEYAHVPKDAFIEKRREILAMFRARDSLYYLPRFREKYDAQAKANLAREIDELPKIIADMP